MLDPRLTIQSEGNEDTKNPPINDESTANTGAATYRCIKFLLLSTKRISPNVGTRHPPDQRWVSNEKLKKKKKSHESNWLYQLPVRNRSLFHIVVIVFNLDCQP